MDDHIKIINIIKKIDKEINNLPKKEFIELIIKHQNLSSVKGESENIYKKKSNLKNAGNGIFAKKDFNVGDIICMYQPYTILDKDDNHVITLDKDRKNYSEILKCYGDYMLNLKHNISLFGNPDYCMNEHYLGHMPNDRGYSPFKRYNDKFNNGFFSFLYLIASKPIKKNQEIFISYGDV